MFGSRNASAGKYWTAAHNLQQSGFVDFTTSEVADGPRHDETWTFTVILTKVYPPYGRPSKAWYTGIGRTKVAARDTACREALVDIGFNIQEL